MAVSKETCDVALDQLQHYLIKQPVRCLSSYLMKAGSRLCGTLLSLDVNHSFVATSSGSSGASKPEDANCQTVHTGFAFPPTSPQLAGTLQSLALDMAKPLKHSISQSDRDHSAGTEFPQEHEGMDKTVKPPVDLAGDLHEPLW